MNETLENILNIIIDSTKTINLNIKQEYENVQEIKASETSDCAVKLLKNYYGEKQIIQDKLFQNVQQVRDKVLEEYYSLQENINEKIKRECFWNTFKEQKPASHPQKQPDQFDCNFQFFFEQNQRDTVTWIAMDKDEKFMASTSQKGIQIWEFNNGEITLKNTLFGHTLFADCLCFSKKENWFISGGGDAIRVWQQDQDDQWFQYQVLDQNRNKQIHEILLDNEENQFISYGGDKIIKIWMKKYGLLWQCVQNISDYIYFIAFLSLSPDCNYLVSGEFVMWEKGDDQLWKFKQDIDSPIIEGDIDLYIEQYYILDARVKFISNDEFLVQVQKYGRLFRVAKNPKGVFQVTSEFFLDFSKNQKDHFLTFPIIYQQRCAIIKNTEKVIQILRLQDNGDFMIQQTIFGEYRAGFLSRNGQYLILSTWTGGLEVWKNA